MQNNPNYRSIYPPQPSCPGTTTRIVVVTPKTGKKRKGKFAKRRKQLRPRESDPQGNRGPKNINAGGVEGAGGGSSINHIIGPAPVHSSSPAHRIWTRVDVDGAGRGAAPPAVRQPTGTIQAYGNFMNSVETFEVSIRATTALVFF